MLASLFALPSHAEGMSNALLEGIACDLPVVRTETGRTIEFLDGNRIVVPMKDSAALAHAIIRMLSDEQQLAAMHRAGLAVADKYFWKGMAESYPDL